MIKKEQIENLFGQFEAICLDYHGVACWSGRALQSLLGYSKWENFGKVVDKAKEACRQAGEPEENHFSLVLKVATMPNGGERQTDDLMLTRYACYLIAQNGDSRKEAIAFAQNYFAVQTRKAELIEERLLDLERVKARAKLSQTENQLSEILYERGIDTHGFALIRSKGDQALFMMSTAQLKQQMGIPEGRPIADFLPTISIKAKDLAAEMTGLKVQVKNLSGQLPIEAEHIDNNQAVREMLTTRDIYPEQLPPAEDVKKLERKLQATAKELKGKIPSLNAKKAAS